jgi:hypothetical protein
MWDVAPDGRRFLFPVLINEARATFTMVLNWQTSLGK